VELFVLALDDERALGRGGCHGGLLLVGEGQEGGRAAAAALVVVCVATAVQANIGPRSGQL
jgi:hypothetical protein